MTIFTVAIFICGVSYSFSMLLIARMISGVGEAGLTTIAPVLISDAAPKGKDSTWVAIYTTAAPLGIGVGDFVGY